MIYNVYPDGHNVNPKCWPCQLTSHRCLRANATPPMSSLIFFRHKDTECWISYIYKFFFYFFDWIYGINGIFFAGDEIPLGRRPFYPDNPVNLVWYFFIKNLFLRFYITVFINFFNKLGDFRSYKSAFGGLPPRWNRIWSDYMISWVYSL